MPVLSSVHLIRHCVLTSDRAVPLHEIAARNSYEPPDDGGDYQRYRGDDHRTHQSDTGIIVGVVGGFRVRDAVASHQQPVRVHAVWRAGDEGRVVLAGFNVELREVFW